jgi:predicted dehydrogenase
MSTIGIALIGAGFIADYHLAGLACVPDAEVRVIASRGLEKARDVARRFGVPEATDDVAAALRRPDIHAVVIIAPDDVHEELAVASLRAGKAVLLQKPMASTSTAARRIIDVAGRTGCDLQVSYMHRHFPEVEEARGLLAGGGAGRAMTVRLRNATPGPDWGDWFFRRDAVSGGVVHQLGIHGIDLVGHLFGPIETVAAHCATLRPERTLKDGRAVRVENPDTAFAVYTLPDGPLVHHEMSLIEAAGTDRFRMEIYGERASLWLRSERGPLALAREGGVGWECPPLSAEAAGERHHRWWIDGLTGRRPAEATGRDGVQGLLVAEAIARSAAAGGAETPVERL